MTGEPCLGLSIWQEAMRRHPEMRTAQQRNQADKFLRAELSKIMDWGLRQHAAEIIREQRNHHFNWQRDPTTEQRLASIERRLTNIEADLAGHSKSREITSIRRDKREIS